VELILINIEAVRRSWAISGEVETAEMSFSVVMHRGRLGSGKRYRRIYRFGLTVDSRRPGGDE
jgi:hypothetical protein